MHVHWVWNIHPNFFWKIVVISGHNKSGKTEIAILAICFCKRLYIQPEDNLAKMFFFVRSANTLESFQKKFQDCRIIIEHNKRGPWGATPVSSPLQILIPISFVSAQGVILSPFVQFSIV